MERKNVKEVSVYL